MTGQDMMDKKRDIDALPSLTSCLFHWACALASLVQSSPQIPRVKPGLVLACAFVFAGSVMPALGVDARLDDPGASHEIALRRVAFERSLIYSSLAPVKQQLARLAALEKQFAEARDYDSAIAARDERKRLQNELARLDKELLLLQTREQALKASVLPDRIKLPLESARLSDLRREGGAITGWAKIGSSATWDLPALPPGGYEVMLRYRCGAAEGGTLLIKEARFTLLSSIETTLRGPEERSAGTLKISNGSGPLTLAAQSLVTNNLMQLLGVELVPSSR